MGGISFLGVGLGFNVMDMLQTAISFLVLYKEYVILVLAVIAVYFLLTPVIRLVNKATGYSLYMPEHKERR